MKKKLTLIVLSSILASPVYADVDDKKSYIITFKKAEIGGSESTIQKLILNSNNSPDGIEQKISDKLNMDGDIIDIYNNINAIHVEVDSDEADRLSALDQVEAVEENILLSLDQVKSAEGFPTLSTQKNTGWGLARIHRSTATSDNSYQYQYDGSGRTIYVLDTGLNINNPKVAAEFGGRASILWDVNFAGKGEDCHGHGSKVSSAAAGKTYGVAKGVTLKMIKITQGCSGSSSIDTTIKSLNWLSEYAPRGSIINWSSGYRDDYCDTKFKNIALDNAVKAVHDAGIFFVTSAGNDGCNTENYSPKNIPESFVVGSTSNLDFANGKDRIASFSRTGMNISTFAPGTNLLLMKEDGQPTSDSGTSFSASYVAGTIAVVCEEQGTRCESGNEDMVTLYRIFRGTGTLNTVTNTDGTTLTGATSRFISQQW